MDVDTTAFEFAQSFMEGLQRESVREHASNQNAPEGQRYIYPSTAVGWWPDGYAWTLELDRAMWDEQLNREQLLDRIAHYFRGAQALVLAMQVNNTSDNSPMYVVSVETRQLGMHMWCAQVADDASLSAFEKAKREGHRELTVLGRLASN